MKSDEFIREVNEEMQQDKLKALWMHYGALIIGAAVLVVAGTAGVVGYQSYQASQLQAQGELWTRAQEALAQGETSDAAQAFAEIGRDFGAGPGAVAAFGEAAALDAGGDPAAAADRLALLGDQSDIDPVLADLAKLKSIQLRIDDDDPLTLIAELEPLAASGSPFSLSARETLAIASLRAGDEERAKAELLSVIEDAFTSDSMQARASELFAAIGGVLPDIGGVDGDAVDGDTVDDESLPQ